MRSTITATMLAGFILAASPASSGAQTYAPQVGHRHPDFTLPRIDDPRPVSLSDYRGKKVLLVHFASW